MPMLEAPRRVLASWLYMSLQGVCFRRSPRNAQIPPTSGHPSLMQGNSCDTRHTHALRNSFVRGSCLLFDIGIARAFSSCSEAAGNCRDGLRSQPVRSARERRRPAAYFRCFWPASAPRGFVGSLNRSAIMSTLDTLPGESNTSIISSIINLVCPQCGGRMSEFQCEGRCCRNWLAEWEWANQATRSSYSRRGHAGRSMR
jgi:hypothetical protein